MSNPPRPQDDGNLQSNPPRQRPTAISLPPPLHQQLSRGAEALSMPLTSIATAASHQWSSAAPDISAAVAANANVPTTLMIPSHDEQEEDELAFPDYENSNQPSPHVANREGTSSTVPPLSPHITTVNTTQQPPRLESPSPFIPLGNVTQHVSEPDAVAGASTSASVSRQSSVTGRFHLRTALSPSSMAQSLPPGANSVVSSPMLAALSDLTPLPSPLVDGRLPTRVWTPSQASRPGNVESEISRTTSDQILPPRPRSRKSSSPTRKKAYGTLSSAATKMATPSSHNPRSHSRTRSLSEYVPETMNNQRPRNVTVALNSQTPLSTSSAQMQREHYLADQRGLTTPTTSKLNTLIPTEPLPPTPPPSNQSDTGSATESTGEECPDASEDLLLLKDGASNRTLKYRRVRALGQGTFSNVFLATSEPKYCTSNLPLPKEADLNPRKLVAIKIVAHSAAGGGDETRVELGLHREVETLISLSHPSLIDVRAFDLVASPSLIVLNYCPGGDLFELATQGSKPLCAEVVARIMAELVDALRYLHHEMIAHRDIKLENVLVNLDPSTLRSPSQPFLQQLPTMNTPVVTLTDLGLCKPIPRPPASPLMTTRCGSEDYAAPEILLGQPYDGRATDAWALGVLLYALMERRLPFDTLPGSRSRTSRPAHRIARCEWVWCRFGNEDGEWDEERFPASCEWGGARVVVEGLLKKVTRGRLGLDAVADMDWLKNAVRVELKRPVDDDDDEEVVEAKSMFQFRRMDTEMVGAEA